MIQESEAFLHDAYASEYDEQILAYECHIADVVFGLCYEYIQPGQRLLDLGIGSGISAVLFSKAGLQVSGMDFSPAMLELCRAKGIAGELKQHNLQQTPWPFSSDKFDHLICCGVLHFLSDLEVVFGESYRLLKDGGIFAFTTRVTSRSATLRRKFEQHNADSLPPGSRIYHCPVANCQRVRLP